MLSWYRSFWVGHIVPLSGIDNLAVNNNRFLCTFFNNKMYPHSDITCATSQHSLAKEDLHLLKL
jgi:hypothetical protein